MDSTGTKVDDLEGIVFWGNHHDIFWFQVAMDDPIHMAVGDGGEELLHVVLGNIFVHVFAFDDAVEELSPMAHLHDDVDKKFFLVHIDDPDDVGMVLCDQKCTNCLRIKIYWICFSMLRVMGIFLAAHTMPDSLFTIL